MLFLPGVLRFFRATARRLHFKIPGFQGNLENTAAYAAGIRRGLKKQGIKNVHVLGFAGDGATVDIGLQALSGAMERGENIIYVCYDNEAYNEYRHTGQWFNDKQRMDDDDARRKERNTQEYDGDRQGA